MRTERWTRIEPIQISPEEVRDAFNWITRGARRAQQASRDLFLPTLDEKTFRSRSGYFSTLHFPPFSEVASRVTLEQILTPYDASHLEGYRLCRIGMDKDAPIGELRRAKGSITSERVFKSEKHKVPKIVEHLIPTLTALMCREISQHGHEIFSSVGFVPDIHGRAIHYSADLLSQLLIDSLTFPERPRLLPIRVLPPKKIVLEVLGELAPYFEYEGPTRLVMIWKDAQYEIREQGDRGEVQIERFDHRVDATYRLAEHVFNLATDSLPCVFNPTSAVDMRPYDPFKEP